MKDYRESHLDPDHAASYDAIFLKNPLLALFWTLEQRVLGGILNTRFRGRPIRLLDFACGSGRILALLEDGVQEAVGVDVSPSMIAIARRKRRVPSDAGLPERFQTTPDSVIMFGEVPVSRVTRQAVRQRIPALPPGRGSRPRSGRA